MTLLGGRKVRTHVEWAAAQGDSLMKDLKVLQNIQKRQRGALRLFHPTSLADTTDITLIPFGALMRDHGILIDEIQFIAQSHEAVSYTLRKAKEVSIRTIRPYCRYIIFGVLLSMRLVSGGDNNKDS